jgi:hypothetical protein
MDAHQLFNLKFFIFTAVRISYPPTLFFSSFLFNASWFYSSPSI